MEKDEVTQLAGQHSENVPDEGENTAGPRIMSLGEVVAAEGEEIIPDSPPPELNVTDGKSINDIAADAGKNDPDNPAMKAGEPEIDNRPHYRGKPIEDMDAGECWQALKFLRPNHPLAPHEPAGDGDPRYRKALLEIMGWTGK